MIHQNAVRRKGMISGWVAAGISVVLAQSVSALAEGDSIAFQSKQVYPEGIAYDPGRDLFFVSSMRYGRIGTVSRNGKYAPWTNDPILISSVGMHVDAERGRLYACISDPGVSVRTDKKTQKKLAKLAVFDLKSRKRVALHDLGKLAPGEHFCNDMTLDQAGNVYVTDSFSPLIFRIDVKGKASVFVNDPRFAAEGFNLNGIVYHPGGYLLVARYNTGELFKIDVADPRKVSKVELPEKMPGADGLILDGESLIVVQNMEANRVVKLSSPDEWASARVVASSQKPLQMPTTGVKAKDGIYVMNAKLNELFDSKAKKSDSFSIERIVF